jgi:hypothetical protein
MPQFRARSAGLQPGISPNADLKVGATSAAALETENVSKIRVAVILSVSEGSRHLRSQTNTGILRRLRLLRMTGQGHGSTDPNFFTRSEALPLLNHDVRRRLLTRQLNLLHQHLSHISECLAVFG